VAVLVVLLDDEALLVGERAHDEGHLVAAVHLVHRVGGGLVLEDLDLLDRAVVVLRSVAAAEHSLRPALPREGAGTGCAVSATVPSCPFMGEWVLTGGGLQVASMA
jgi:hypothetical protein